MCLDSFLFVVGFYMLVVRVGCSNLVLIATFFFGRVLFQWGIHEGGELG